MTGCEALSTVRTFGQQGVFVLMARDSFRRIIPNMTLPVTNRAIVEGSGTEETLLFSPETRLEPEKYPLPVLVVN